MDQSARAQVYGSGYLGGTGNARTGPREIYPGANAPGAYVPHRYTSFILEPGEKKVVMTLDTRMPNTSIFTFNKEDHTLGNLLRAHLLKHSHVTFAAYKVPHPLFPKFELHVRTDGQVTPKEALLGTCGELIAELNILGKEFQKEYELRKMADSTSNGN